jgi:hypothetical protein
MSDFFCDSGLRHDFAAPRNDLDEISALDMTTASGGAINFEYRRATPQRGADRLQ